MQKISQREGFQGANGQLEDCYQSHAGTSPTDRNVKCVGDPSASKLKNKTNPLKDKQVQ